MLIPHALGKLLRCSGFEEILVESGICASGSISKVMSGKHYNRAMRVHKLTLEALERLLFKKFEEVYGLDCASEAKDTAISNPSQDVVNQAMENGNYENLFDLYESFKEEVRSGGTLAKHRNFGWTIWIRSGLCYDFSEQPSLTI